MPFGQNVEQTIMNNIAKAHGSTIPSLATSKVLPQVGFSDMGIFGVKMNLETIHMPINFISVTQSGNKLAQLCFRE